MYINYHRPSKFSTDKITKGKIKKLYNKYLTPYNKFLSLDNFNEYLRKEINLNMLKKISKERSDNEQASLMQRKKIELFKKF